MYLEGINKYNELGGADNGVNNVVSENGSNGGSNNGRENNSGSGSGSGLSGSNQAYLDSTAGHLRNISGSNAAGSGSGNGNSGSNGSNIQYVPILVMCCPNLLRGEPCYCGH